MVVEIKKRFRRPVGFRFDAMAVFLICEQYGIDLDGMDKIPKDEYVTSWVWSGHRSFCMLNYRKPMTFEQMKRYIARMRKTEWDKILDAMANMKAEGDEDKKKVQPGMNSLPTAGKQE